MPDIRNAAEKSFAAENPEPMHVEPFTVPPGIALRVPLVFVHGGHHTGACWERTPDGRIGWAPYATERGHPAYVVDWPGHGRSSAPSPAGVSLGDVAEAVAELLATLGRAVLVTHSMGGVVGWRAAELARPHVAAIAAIAPGPPANLQPPLSSETIRAQQISDPAYGMLGQPMLALAAEQTPTATMARALWANSARFPAGAFDAYFATLVPEGSRALNERNNIDGTGIGVSGPEPLHGIPIAVFTGDNDPRHPYAVDAAVAAYFGAEFVWLADRGLAGHGHMCMIEDGNLAVADLVLDWIAAHT
jgi:pimeloyl-ACP methyl ester carboxylesterase